ncbi:hypothetical protein PANO111632_07795 [Paracoccus nototheniae]|uniref:Rad50/SbcC-type AAA domain-containing protein n=1 Tax=Paracoccus nototheniae TaxID=2489002 RepID=A0ABW4DTU8_9RHOB|nr:hypothetical protein [Paracoccus nototheniae]
MAYLAEIRLTGAGIEDALIRFLPGPNVVTGDSDTGKSYLLRLVDYVLGADELTKVINEAADYELAWVEFREGDNILTLERHLSGGDVHAHSTSIANLVHTEEGAESAMEAAEEGHLVPPASSDPEVLVARRRGQQKAPDVTSRVLPFFGMGGDVQLRKNNDGSTQRLSIRTLIPAFLVNEDAIIAEGSPIISIGYDTTPAKRMFSYLLTGKDDAGIIAHERAELTKAKIKAKIGLVDELLAPIEERLYSHDEADEAASVKRLTATINDLSNTLEMNAQERAALRDERAERNEQRVRADTQLLAIHGMLVRYHLLDERYTSDLQRLDFLSEGVHYFGHLQDTSCPLCGQRLGSEPHRHQDTDGEVADAAKVREATVAEAGKIRGLQHDLGAAIADLEARQNAARTSRAEAATRLDEIDTRLDQVLAPGRQRTQATLNDLVRRRLHLQALEDDRGQYARLVTMRQELEGQLPRSKSTQTWAPLDPAALTRFCREVEAVLKAWSWADDVRVEFEEDRDRYDIKVNGKPRRSHGKGLRAVLHAAFSVALLCYCRDRRTPHPGFLVLDSPLTTVKQRLGTPRETPAGEDEIDGRIEPMFWNALSSLDPGLQIIVLENKEPAENLHDVLNLQLFAGADAEAFERAGFIPGVVAST